MAEHSGKVLAVQGVEDPLFFGLFSALALELKTSTGCRPELIQIRSINSAVGTGWIPRILRSWPISALINRQWANASRHMLGRVAYQSNSLSHPFGDLADWFRAHRLWRSLQRLSDISALTIDGVVVGDLVIDSFLRFRPAPRFDVSDPFVRQVLWQCIRDLRRAKRWFGRVRPPLFLSSYSTYVEHGVAARVALSLGTSVYVYGNLTTFGKQLSMSNPFHTSDTGAYRRVFESLPDQDAILKQASQQLSLRLSGGIDMATAYMRVSAYATNGEVVPDVRGAVVVFMHDFFDSPHIYPNLIFPDFWTWLDCTILTLREAGIPFWVKPHPNQIALSSDAFNEFQVRHTDVRILSAQITNTQLVQAGMLCGVTVYGTVAHELAYLGVPSIACAQHPHHAFEFCRTATSLADYVYMLRTPNQLPIPLSEMKRQALAFYYMHNIHGEMDSLDVRRQFIELWKTSQNPSASGEELCRQLDLLRNKPGWRTHIYQLMKEFTAHAN